MKPYLVLLYPGPNYSPAATFNERLLELSKTFRGTLVCTAPSNQQLRLHGFDVIVVSREGGKIRTVLRLVSTLFRLGRFRRKYGGIDLVSTYDPLRSGLLGVCLKYLSRAKLAVEVNGDYNDPANYRDVRSKSMARFKRHVYVAVESFVLGRADGIKLLYKDQINAFGIDEKSKVISVFANRVSTDLFNISSSQKYILTVGFPWQVKGIDITVNAFKGISEKYPDWKLKILGWYQDSAELEKIIDRHPKIDLAAPVAHEKMPEVVGHCGVFVLASRTESMGRVLIEAMAAGKARIGTRVGGIPTVIDHMRDGIIVEPESAPALSAAMDRLLGDSNLRETLGRNAKARLDQEFTKDAYYGNLLSFYNEVLTYFPSRADS